ncbi:uncharacterized protein EDB91DRAFT_1148248 [Suillus paluster]|uniref:uncharacterized protein n=1 Tax=Suillus paluster TaxID=48578 RepID=UPI001B87F16D|nr:uncharacterized protein EDB91DRAFT_1148248 [Suillus paluster]KAG1733592.1 hypothetical protein EDB91DRAFT_1148248 [Suillus paluster]
MDNPQHYQPLSHALHPPVVPTYEEEEEEEENEDEGAVEEQLDREDDEHEVVAGSAQQASATAAGKQGVGMTQPDPPQDAERKRRPGRPRGSKNRRTRASVTDLKEPANAASKTSPPQHGFYQYTASPAPGEIIQPHNQQYYEFQWRVLNLCAEFYGAAEELVKATPSLVIAQCYQMGPAVKVDPLAMLGEAKRICDTLLASPSRLTTHPPPPPYFVPAYQAPIAPPQPQPQPGPSTSTTNGKSPATTGPVISDPQSFVVSLGHQQAYPYAPAYPTAPYYGYGGYGGYYPPVPAPGPSTAPTTGSASGSTGGAAGSGGNQGAWSEEETERLKKLAEEHRNGNGEIVWDTLCEKWGNSRTRHQILIKATSLGLKESSSRGMKRKRETDGQLERPPPAAPTPTSTDAPHHQTPAPNPVPTPVPQSAQGASASPTPSTPAPGSTHPSPAIRHAQTQQQQQQVHQQPPRSLPYPMPTVAAATSPVISTNPMDRPGSGSYYRTRPAPGMKPASSGSTHQFMYQPNGGRREG